MGSTTWIEFTPYQIDTERALQDLREEVFRSGAYEYHIGSALNYGSNEKWDAEGNARFQAMVEAARERAKTIDGLLGVVGDSGTHSLIDVRHTSTEPDYGVICPATQDQLMDWFDTDKPTKDLAQEREMAFIDEEFPHYFIVYQDNTPKEICFFGTTGN